jgi:branched-chain amino acid transport system ATP-binding protein
MWRTIRLVRDSGIAIIVVDKTVSAVLSLADRVTVLVKGSVVYSGSPQVLREDAKLMHRHIGV